MTPTDSQGFTVGAFGMLTWDQLLRVDDYPQPGTYQIVRNSVDQSGGTTGNMAVALSRLGVDVALASRVGDDDLGARLLEELRDEGCNVDHVRVIPDTPTDRGVIIVSGAGPDSDRTILWLQGARLKHGDHLPVEAFFSRDLVLLDVDDARLRLLLLDLPMHVSPRTRIFGTMTFLAEFPREHALELALRHDYLSGNVGELRYVTACDDLDEATRQFQGQMIHSQVRFAAISDGPNGCLILTRDDIVRVPAFEIDVQDPTGAGDAFAAGIAFGILSRWDLETVGRFGNAMGALATRQLGARASLPTLEEVLAFKENASVRLDHAGNHPGD